MIATIGSLGDLHPCLALAVALRERGHSVVVATTPFYRERIERLNLEFLPMGPAFDPEDPELIRRVMDLRRGPEYLFRELFLPHLRSLYAELDAACVGADLLLASEVVFAAPLVGAKRGLPWVSVILSPSSFISAHDPSRLPGAQWLERIRGAPWFHRAMAVAIRQALRSWAKPIQDFRRELGLPATPDAILRDKFAANLILTLFSKHFAAPQPDWPRHCRQPGFVYYSGSRPNDARLESFLANGPPPIVFTLGSAAVHAPGDFFQQSADVAGRLGSRAVLVGAGADLGALENEATLVVNYADFTTLFPRATAVVHQGGIGTTAQTLRAGVPALITPHGFDQPDNAARVERLGAGLTLSKKRYAAPTARGPMHRLLHDAGFRDRAAALAMLLRAEDGLSDALEAIEGVLPR